eukprot:scaffold8960_cov154-Skeletonema_menzelii.AAC.3
MPLPTLRTERGIRLRRKMWCWWPSQIKPHQDIYEAVALLSIERFHSAEDLSFPTIGTEYNGALAPFNRHNAGVACDYDVRCGAGGHPKSSLIRSASRLYCSRNK